MSDILVPLPPESPELQVMYEDSLSPVDLILSATEMGDFICPNHGKTGEYRLMWFLPEHVRAVWHSQRCHECGLTLMARPRGMKGNA